MLNDQGETLQQIGQYEVREKIAEGGFGVVYLARDPRLNREVAIKVLHAYHASEPARIARFVREAQSAAKLNHPGIVQIYDVVETAGRMALVMEYIRGKSLDDYLKAHPDLTLNAKLEIAAQIGDTLDAAHEMGIVHRDIKPANVMVEDNGRVKLTDFSLARLIDSSLTPLTGENNVLGTPAYMSPEQCLGKEAGPQSDIYSLGVIIYYMATGSMPFDADNYLALMRQHTETPPTPVRLLKPSLPVTLERLIMRCLSKSVDKRPASGKEVSQSLRQMLRDDFVDVQDPTNSKTVCLQLPEGFAENAAAQDAGPASAGGHTPVPMPVPESFAQTPQPMAPNQVPGMANMNPMAAGMGQGVDMGAASTPMQGAPASTPMTPQSMQGMPGQQFPGMPGMTPQPMQGMPGMQPMMPQQQTPDMQAATPMPMQQMPTMQSMQPMTPQPMQSMPGMQAMPGMTPQPMQSMQGMVGMTPQPMQPMPGMQGMTPMPMAPQPSMMGMPGMQDPAMTGMNPMYTQGMPGQSGVNVIPPMPAPAANRQWRPKVLWGLVGAGAALAVMALVFLSLFTPSETETPPSGSTMEIATGKPETPKPPEYQYDTALADYAQTPDDNYAYSLHSKLKGEGYTAYVLDMASQTWHADKTVPPVWRHWLTIIVPERLVKDKAMLVLSDGFSAADRPLAEVPVVFVAMAISTKSVVAILEGFPRDPVGFYAEKGQAPVMDQDAFTVASFLRFLDTGDPTWPIVCPLVKTAVRAMDTVQSYLVKDLRSEIPVEGFVLTGDANGWAIWLTGPVDSRVVAIAPVQFDLLNIDAQIKQQVGLQGEMSPFLAQCGNMDLLPALDSLEGERLLRLIDPYTYRDRLTMPKLILLPSGTNAYSTVDAANLYIKELPGDVSLFCTPNLAFSRGNPFLPQQVNSISEGEPTTGLATVQDFRDTLQVFYHKVLVDKAMPKFTWEVAPDGAFRVVTQDRPVEARLWVAKSENRNFSSDAQANPWQVERLSATIDGVYESKVRLPGSKYTALYVELVFPSMLGTNFSLTTPVTVLTAMEKPSKIVEGENLFRSLPGASASSAPQPSTPQ